MFRRLRKADRWGLFAIPVLILGTVFFAWEIYQLSVHVAIAFVVLCLLGLASLVRDLLR